MIDAQLDTFSIMSLSETARKVKTTLAHSRIRRKKMMWERIESR